MSTASEPALRAPFSVVVGPEVYDDFASFDDAERLARQLAVAQRRGAEIRHLDGLTARVVPDPDGGTRTDLEMLGVMLESARAAAAYGEAMTIRELLRRAPLPFRTSRVVRDGLIGILTRGRITIAEAGNLGLKIKPTLFLPEHGIVLEFVSKFEPIPPVWTRLERYAAHPAVQAMLLVRHGDIDGMPIAIGGKPVLLARVGGRR